VTATFLKVDRCEAGIVVVSLDRPERPNALTFEAFDPIAPLCREIQADPSARRIAGWTSLPWRHQGPGRDTRPRG